MKYKQLILLGTLVLLFEMSYSKQTVQLNVDSLLLDQHESIKSTIAIDQFNENINVIFQQNFPNDKDDFERYIIKTLEIAHDLGYEEGEAQANYSLGKFYIVGSSDYSRAIPAILEGLSLFQNHGDSLGVAKSYMQLGLIGYITQYFDDALKNFRLSLAYYDYGTSIYLMAITYSEIEEYEKAKHYFIQALHSFEAADNVQSIMECNLYLGRMYANEGKYDSAHFYLNKALKSKVVQTDRSLLARPFALLSEYYLQTNQFDSALYCGHMSFDSVRTRTDILSPVIAANVLSKVYEKKGDYEKANRFLKAFMNLKNENMKGDTRQKIAEMQSMFEFEKKMAQEKLKHEEEIRRENQKKNALLISSGFILLIAGGLWSRLQFVRKSKTRIQFEKDRSESLLLNILPVEVADELKQHGKSDARDFDSVTVLFTDFVQFTEKAESLTAQELVSEINACFEAFDAIITQYGLEKIKTIGDAYMAAGGLPIPTRDSVKNSVLAALKMQTFIEERQKINQSKGLPAFTMRVGIHTGPVVAGIVGVKKFQYDIWGDTVNTASRMESHGEVGKVNISQNTYEMIKDDPQFRFENRGKVAAKGKGDMEMLFVSKK